MTDHRPLAARVFVEPLGRAVLGGVPIELVPVPGDDAPADPGRRPLDVGLLPLFSDERPLTGLAGYFDWRLGGALSRLVRSQWCTGEIDQAALMPGRRTLPVSRIVVFGLGPSARFDVTAARRAAAEMVGCARRLVPRDVLLAMPGKGSERAIVEAVFDAALDALSEPPDPSADLPACTWWVVADPRHVARLRRVLDGPPRAASHAE